MEKKGGTKLQKTYFDVLGLCCSSEIPVIERILGSLSGVKDFSVVVPTKTVIVIHDSLVVSQLEIVKALNKERLEANVRPQGVRSYKNRLPSPYAVASGACLLLSLLRYAWSPLKWLTIAGTAVGIIPVFLKAVTAIRNFTIEINILILIAVAGSIALKDYWEANTIVFLFTIAEWLELSASHKATAAMSSLLDVVPQRAVIAETGEEVNADEVKMNTVLAVKAGEAIPIDGIVVEGTCEVDEKFLTGESFPVAKQKDSTVWASTINLNGYITIRTTAVAEDCVVARMAKLVEESQNKKSRVQRILDKCAKYYTPVIVLISAILALVPVIFHLHDKGKFFHLSLVVLVSGCPCALLLSTPVAMFCALSEAARLGILFKGAEHLETLAKIKIMAFDKTGTITKAEFRVADFTYLLNHITADKLLYWISSIESKSSHPMASALVDYAREHEAHPQPEKVHDFRTFPGEGISGRIQDQEVFVGNSKLASRAGFTGSLESYGREGMSTGYAFIGSSLAGIFHLTDSCRTGAKEALKDLKLTRIRCVMLTGDSKGAAEHAQAQLGGILDAVHAGLLPTDKERIIKELQKEGPTAMVGDGINDAPALAAADVGISMGVSGSALATETGHVVLMTNDIGRIPRACRIAKRARWKIIENVTLAFVTKAGVLALAAAGHPLVWAAVLADVGTCLLVIFNSMLLLKRGKFHWHCLPHSHGDDRKTSASCSSHCHSEKKCCSEVQLQKTCCSSASCSEKKKIESFCADIESQKKCCQAKPSSHSEHHPGAHAGGESCCSDHHHGHGHGHEAAAHSFEGSENRQGHKAERSSECCSDDDPENRNVQKEIHTSDCKHH